MLSYVTLTLKKLKDQAFGLSVGGCGFECGWVCLPGSGIMDINIYMLEHNEAFLFVDSSFSLFLKLSWNKYIFLAFVPLSSWSSTTLKFNNLYFRFWANTQIILSNERLMDQRSHPRSNFNITVKNMRNQKALSRPL